jgi:hypothetical protein
VISVVGWIDSPLSTPGWRAVWSLALMDSFDGVEEG